MAHAKEVQREYFDKRVRESHPYEVGDWVWLLRRNISSQRPSPKLDFKKLGPFRIEAVINPVVYRLTLPPELKRLHPVFHTALLLPFVDPKSFPGRKGPSAPRGPTTSRYREFDETDVESIIGYRQLSIQAHEWIHEYLVTWRNGSTADNSWVKGGLLALSLHPYIEEFHELYGDSSEILTADNAIRIPHP
ncbi:hypothetical protein PSTG_17012 [Puccinia striiformis f. sp. tritici PST-78]|uniref:Tf2-1-like SH3-like domain-containing protein n=1 Tax=Puccinia striiformis f. sp. tritici PST-78 TaxID=1165861 RepID=A0A0L0URD6_9BASI|nr:hypothetical protein PSTG_17012 [Puccinia striiformis f. sp. tritici PST-78]